MVNALTYFIVGILCFWIPFNIVYMYNRRWFEERGFKLYYMFILMWKREYSIRSSRLIGKLSYASIPLALLGLYFFYTSMILAVMAKFSLVVIPAKPQLLIPGLNITGINLLYFVIAIVIAAAIHEAAHAYVAKSHGIEVKGFGFVILLFLPIAFTEIDDEYYKKARLRSKAVTLMAGPASNIVLGLIVLAIIQIVTNVYALTIVDLWNETLAHSYGLDRGMVITGVNGEPATLDNLHKALAGNNTVVKLEIMYSNGSTSEIIIHKAKNESIKLGVLLAPYAPAKTLIETIGLENSMALLYQVHWLYIVNMGLGAINIAPLFITDGGKLAYEITKKKNIGHIINTATLAILILALTP